MLSLYLITTSFHNMLSLYLRAISWNIQHQLLHSMSIWRLPFFSGSNENDFFFWPLKIETANSQRHSLIPDNSTNLNYVLMSIFPGTKYKVLQLDHSIQHLIKALGKDPTYPYLLTPLTASTTGLRIFLFACLQLTYMYVLPTENLHRLYQFNEPTRHGWSHYWII